MFENISTEYFNLIEGCFWVILGFACFIIYFKAKTKYKKLALFSAFVLITFGISDFFQVVYGSFLLPNMEWLFVWKIVDVIGLCAMFLFYLIIRIRQ